MSLRRDVLVAVGAVLCAAAAGLGVAPAASADEQPAILKAYGLDWIERVKEEAWPQPKKERPVICLLDTGVAVTPDTPEDNPAGPIVARLALDGGSGFPQGTEFAHLHGTQMASVIAAPRNDYGTVGVFPQARIVSVRVTDGVETFITPRAVALGVNRCSLWARAASVRVATVVMAESNYDQRVADLEQWQAAAARSVNEGAVFVAALGNAAGASIVAPAAIDDIVTVAAGDSARKLCSFAEYSTTGGILGPGCGDAEWPSGSSSATAAIGAALAALVARDPVRATADRVRSDAAGASAVGPDGVRRFDGSSYIDAYFGGGLVAEAEPEGVKTAEQPPSQPLTVARESGREIPGGAESDGKAASVRLWRPKFEVTWQRGRLKVVRRDSGPRGKIAIRVSTTVYYRTGPKRASVRVRRPRTVEAWVEGKAWRSLSVRIKVQRL